MRVSLVAIVLLAVGCGGGGDRSDVAVLDARTWPDSNVVALHVASCNASPTVQVVEETTEEVRVKVVADDPGPNVATGDCADGGVACLSQPLGERTLIDDTSGDVVSVDDPYSADVPDCP